jgi:hypothetical protein
MKETKERVTEIAMGIEKAKNEGRISEFESITIIIMPFFN